MAALSSRRSEFIASFLSVRRHSHDPRNNTKEPRTYTKNEFVRVVSFIPFRVVSWIVSYWSVSIRVEAGQRISVERVRLPGHSVPWAIRVSDYLHRHDDAIGAKLVSSGNAIVNKFPLSIDGEFERTDQVSLIHHLDFVIARIFVE